MIPVEKHEERLGPGSPVEEDPRKWLVYLAVSLVCHFLLFVAMIFMPEFAVRKVKKPTAITVDLVSFSPASSLPLKKGGSGGGQRKEVVKKTPVKVKKKSAKIIKKKSPPKARPEPVKTKSAKTPEVAEAVREKAPSPVPGKKKVKKSLKKKTYKAANILKRAREKLEQGIEETRPDPMAGVLERLRSKVENEPGGAAEFSGGEGESEGRPALNEIEVYRRIIADNIQNNWAFSPSLARGRRDLEVVILIKIMPSGEIREMGFESRSGNRYLDDSAYKAVQKSNPLPALPRGYKYYHTTLGFTPRGVE